MYSAALLPTWVKFCNSLVPSENDFSPESMVATAASAETSTVCVVVPTASVTFTSRCSPPPKPMASALVVLETLDDHSQGVVSNWHGGKGVVALVIGSRFALGSRQGIF